MAFFCFFGFCGFSVCFFSRRRQTLRPILLIHSRHPRVLQGCLYQTPLAVPRHYAKCQADAQEVAPEMPNRTDLISRGSPCPPPLTTRPRCRSSGPSDRLLPQGLCMCLSFCLECSSPDIHVTPCLPSFHIFLKCHPWSGWGS